MIFKPKDMYNGHKFIRETYTYKQFREQYCRDVYNKNLLGPDRKIKSAYIGF